MCSCLKRHDPYISLFYMAGGLCSYTDWSEFTTRVTCIQIGRSSSRTRVTMIAGSRACCFTQRVALAGYSAPSFRTHLHLYGHDDPLSIIILILSCTVLFSDFFHHQRFFHPFDLAASRPLTK
jgi:hypothetical protein